MKVRDTKKEKNTVYGYLLSLIATAVTVVVFATVTMSFAGQTGGREEEILEKTITGASVQCYAIGRRCPPSVEYLKENYGVQTNRKKHNVFCDGFASNVMLEINIILIGEQGVAERLRKQRKRVIP